MNAMTHDFSADVAHACSVLTLTADNHEAKLDSLADIHRKNAGEAELRIVRTKKDLKRVLAAFKAQIADIERQMAEAKEGAARKIATDEQIVTACRAFLAAVD